MSLTFTEAKPAYNKVKVRALKLLKGMAPNRRNLHRTESRP
jgi:hypothetical protein